MFFCETIIIREPAGLAARDGGIFWTVRQGRHQRQAMCVVGSLQRKAWPQPDLLAGALRQLDEWLVLERGPAQLRRLMGSFATLCRMLVKTQNLVNNAAFPFALMFPRGNLYAIQNGLAAEQDSFASIRDENTWSA
jgi:hypothetical protein